MAYLTLTSGIILYIILSISLVLPTNCLVTNEIINRRRFHLHATNEYNFDDDDDDGTDDEDCDIRRRPVKNFFLISDSTGTTSKSVLERALVQFSSCDDRFYNFDGGTNNDECSVQAKSFAHLRTFDDILPVVQRAAEEEAIVIYTLSDESMRRQTSQTCLSLNVRHVDLLGPLLDVMSDFLQKTPLGVPLPDVPRKIVFSESYYRRVEAVEFTLQADDGAAPWLLSDADVVLVGVSRTGKTPLSVVLSQTQGLKVANVPLVLECAPPGELFDLDPSRVFCLKINPNELKTIRRRRLENRGVTDIEKKLAVDLMAKSNYADRNYLLKDLKNARDLANANNWTEIDVTGRAIEDTASYISSILTRRFPDLQQK